MGGWGEGKLSKINYFGSRLSRVLALHAVYGFWQTPFDHLCSLPSLQTSRPQAASPARPHTLPEPSLPPLPGREHRGRGVEPGRLQGAPSEDSAENNSALWGMKWDGGMGGGKAEQKKLCRFPLDQSLDSGLHCTLSMDFDRHLLIICAVFRACRPAHHRPHLTAPRLWGDRKRRRGGGNGFVEKVRSVQMGDMWMRVKLLYCVFCAFFRCKPRNGCSTVPRYTVTSGLCISATTFSAWLTKIRYFFLDYVKDKMFEDTTILYSCFPAFFPPFFFAFPHTTAPTQACGFAALFLSKNFRAPAGEKTSSLPTEWWKPAQLMLCDNECDEGD